MSLSPISDALHALRAGTPVIVIDDELRESEGSVVLAAETATTETLASMGHWMGGLIGLPVCPQHAAVLQLTPTSPSLAPAAGADAEIRAEALRAIAATDSALEHRPWYLVPLIAAEGGVTARAGHTEATVDLLKLAGLTPVGALAELVARDGQTLRPDELLALSDERDWPIVSIADLVAYRRQHATDGSEPTPRPRRVSLRAEATVPTNHGTFRFLAFKDHVTGMDHLAIVSGELSDTALVRVHSECLTGEAFGSQKCECGPQLDAALQAINDAGGVVIYMRGHEGRGIGLINKLRAYSLQEMGLDTLDANLALGLPADARDYGAAAAMLQDLGVQNVRLLTNNSNKVAQLTDLGLTVVEQVPLVVGVGPNNHVYLETKRDRMGHIIADGRLEAAMAATPPSTDAE